jgi:hypothetical protein
MVGASGDNPHVIVPQFSPQSPAKARLGMNRARHIQRFIRRFEL